MSNAIPDLPSKRHLVDADKALNRVNENISHYHDTGATSRSYQIVCSKEELEKNAKTSKAIWNIQTNTTIGDHENKIGRNNLDSLNNLNKWRDKMAPKASVINANIISLHFSENSDLSNEAHKLTKRQHLQNSNIIWEEVDLPSDKKDAIYQIITKRKFLNWNIKLPVYGAGVNEAMKNYVDRQDTEFVKTKDDDGEFVYCLPKHRNNTKVIYTPYDLEIVNKNEIVNENIYFTCSATYVTMVNKSLENGIFITPTMQWIWERKIFYMLRNINTFKKFRKWRTFKCLSMNVRQDKNERCRRILTRRLFCANEIFQSVLLHVRMLCERASSSRNGLGIGDYAIIMIKYDPNVTMSLQDFCNKQNEQIDFALKQLLLVKEEVMNVTYESCLMVGELEGIDFNAILKPDEFFHKETAVENFIEHKYTRTTKMRDKNFTFPLKNLAGPSFSQQTEWRYILKRICEFLRNVDYLMQELLHRIVKTSVEHLYFYISKSFQVAAKSEEDQNKINFRSTALESSNSNYTDISKILTRPVSTINEKYDEHNITEKASSRITVLSIQKQTPLDLIMQEPIPEIKNAEDITKLLEEIKAQSVIIRPSEPIFHTELVLNIERKEVIISAESDDEYSDEEKDIATNIKSPMKLYKTGQKHSETPSSMRDDTQMEYPQSIKGGDSIRSSKAQKSSTYRVYVTLSPNEGDFKNAVQDLIFKFEKTAGKIQTLLHEPKFRIFYETPDYELTRVGRDLKQSMNLTEENTKTPWPEVEFLFGEDTSYLDIVSDIMRNVTTCLSNTIAFSKNFDKYCKMVDSALKLNIDETINERNWTPDEFQYLLSKYTDQITAMSNMIVSQRIGFLQVMGSKFKENTLPYPNHVIKAIDAFLPPMAVRRNEKLQETMRDALKMLSNDPASVEEFVEHLSVLSRINNELPALEKEFSIVNRFFTISKDFNLNIAPENYAFFKSLGPTFHHLKSSLLYTEAQSEDNIRKFTIDLNQLILKGHNESIEVKTRLHSPRLLSLDITPQIANENLTLFEEMIQKLVDKAKNYASYQERFGNTMKQVKKKLTQPDYMQQDYNKSGITILTLQSDLNELEHDISLRKLLWTSISEWDLLVRDWLNRLLEEIKVDMLQRDVNRFTQNIFMLEKGLPHNELVPKLKEKVLDFKKAMPIIIALRNPNLKPRHWNQLRLLIGRGVMDDEKLTMGLLLDADILQYKDKISDVSSLATNEATLEAMLNKIIDVWKKTDFRIVADHSKDTFVITSTEEIQILLEESQLTMATIKSSRYVTPIKTQVEDWDRKLVLFAKTLEEWTECQKKWLYLEQIFSASDIQRQLPQESKIFSQIEKYWRELMRKTDDKPNAMRAATTPGLMENLQTINLQMEKIQRSLEDYFETKRLVFPRLYFLSNEDLLDILSQAKEPLKIQPYLNKCFGNMQQFELSTKLLEITHIMSSEGEKIEMAKPLRIRGATEQWLLALENAMYETVKKHLKVGLGDFVSTPYKDWVLKHGGQTLLVVSQINFNKQIVSCLLQSKPVDSLETYRANLIKTINSVTGLVSQEMPNYKLMSIEALLTLDVHSRDILSSLITNKISSADDFEWTKHLRYEWDDNNNQCSVMQSDGCFNYGYEYLGCSPRLVITPLTDRCYLTLTGALKLHLGGAPAGPAGTGKTETVKDLAKSIGKLCLVFNCSESLDYKILGKFFSGLAQSGSWCCFDEFNRIDIEVLSVVSQQMLTIKTAKDALAPRFLFEGRDIKLNVTCGFFITMNPTYAGRVELPDNLKPLFRPVAMMVPDYALIAEIILFSVGFTSAKTLAAKIVTLYHLASRQLSQQDHYDFGMRAIKSVLLMAGQVKKNWISQYNTNQNVNEDEETQILMQSLYDTNLPKFLKEDVALFQNLMNDLFPNSSKSKKKQDAIEKAISIATRELNYQSWPSQTEKIVQLYNQILVRHGIMLVGSTGSGKTVARQVLQRALTIIPTYPSAASEKSKSSISNQLDEMSNHVSNSQHKVKFQVASKDFENEISKVKIGKQNYSFKKGKSILKEMLTLDDDESRNKKGKVESYTINPKSITIDELYGKSDPNTFEWADGLLGNAIKQFTAPNNAADNEHENLPLWQWVILDGPVDTLWVENLNSVLDDSKVLCLPNGERIGLTPTIRVFFEVDSLLNASPATISRCAMVYFESSDLDVTPYLKNWFASLPKDVPANVIDLLNELFEFSLDAGFKWIANRKGCTHFPIHKYNIIQTLCAILYGFIDFFHNHGGFGEQESEKDDTKEQKSKRNLKEEDTMYSESTSKQYFIHRNPKQFGSMFSKIFIFAYIWGFGGSLKREDNAEDDNIVNQKSHVKSVTDSITEDFDDFIRDLFDSNVKYAIYIPPNTKPVFDYFIDIDSGNFVEWNILVPTAESLIRKEKHSEIVETIDLVRYSFLCSLILMTKHPVLLTGSSGVGKSVLVQHMLKRLSLTGYSSKVNTILGDVFNFSDKNKVSLMNNLSAILNEEGEKPKKMKAEDINIIPNIIQFSAQTNSQKFLTLLSSKLTKKGQNVLGAPKNKWIITFIDDLNMPIADKFGDQPPLELLRYINENNGFQDTSKCVFKSLTDCTFIVSCDPPSSGRNTVSQRLLRQFCILAMPEPSARSLLHIYQVQLGKFFSDHDFSSEVKSSLLPLISASLVIWYRIVISMLPTPTKSHYIFNLRDLSKLVKGLMQANSLVIFSKESLVNLFSHECIRVFNDRLITQEDNELFFHHLGETVMDYFKITIKNPYKSNNSRQKDQLSQAKEELILYGDFIKHDDRVYQPLTDWKQLTSVLSDYQMRSSMAGHHMQRMVFFKEAAEHICRACRILRQEGGNMLLIGLDGTGKHTTIELASYICHCELFKLNIRKGYNHQDFRDDIKTVFKLTGIQQKKIVFFIADNDIYEESFLEDLDSLLSSGNIPELFDNDELESVLMELKSDAMAAGLSDERNELYKYLINRVQSRLHIVLSMSPAGSTLRERCRFHPAIINCTNIDWFNDWSDGAMEQVSEAFLENVDLSIDSSNNVNQNSNEIKMKLSKACVHIHKSVIAASIRFTEEYRRYYCVTPSFYIDLLRTFMKIFESKRAEHMHDLNRLKTGLEKLSEANELVNIMKEELVLLGPKIEKKEDETHEIMAKLLKDQDAVNEVRAIVSNDEEKMRADTDLVQRYAQEAEKDLNDVMPLLAAATESLYTLKKSDISEIRVYTSPPYLVITVMCAVCVILGKKPDWTTAKQLLADPEFINKLIDFNKETMTDKTYNKIKQFSKNPDFNPEIVGKVSIACKSLCSWVIALQTYHEVYRTVKPKEAKVKEANEALDLMRTSLKRKQDMLQEIQGHLDSMQKKYQDSLDELEKIKNRKEVMRVRLERAAELTTALDVEKIRWAEQHEDLNTKSESIIGVSLICAAAVNYLGAMTQDYREKLFENWLSFFKNEISLSLVNDFDFSKLMIPQHIIRTWISQSLPDDQYSIENALFIKNSLKWPLIIDPQNQAARWIKEMEGSALKICKSEDSNLFRSVEQALRLGQPILIENIGETIDPALDPILRKEIITRGAQKLLKLGNVEVDYNDSFRLYLITSLSNPQYLPSTFIKVNLINFTITFKCLFEQFLSLVVLKERPELEDERANLLESIASDTTTLRLLEDKSLTILTNSETSGNSDIDSKTLLDDQNLIDVLKQSKETSSDIYRRLIKNEETEKRLDLARRRYSAVATRGAILYFVVHSLSSLNVMYQFSLSWFYTVFQSCLGNIHQSQDSVVADDPLPQSAGRIRASIAQVITKKSISITPSFSRPATSHSANLQPESELDAYINSIITSLTYTVYQVVSWALFAEHQLIFPFALSVNILKHSEDENSIIKNSELNFFLNSTVIADLNEEQLTRKYNELGDTKFSSELLLDEKLVKQLLLLEDIFPDKFKGTIENMQTNHESLWKDFKNTADPYEFMELDSANVNYDFRSISKFQKIILIKLLRKDALIKSIQSFITETLGPKFLTPSQPTLQELYNLSVPQFPVIFILSPGSDPTNHLLRFAKDFRGSTLHMDIVSLGQGQGPKAEELIIKSQILKGRWIFLQNCHLAASFMPRLQILVGNLNRPGAEIDQQFRLFLSSKPDANFPVSLLQTGVKMTIESPRGLKNNLRQNLGPGGLVNKRLFETDEYGDLWKRLLFNLSFIHALIHERKKFGPLGWNLAYEFNSSDLEVAINTLQSILTSKPKDIPFNVIKYITGEVIYGGRVTDDFDRRCLMSILGNFFCNDAIKDDHSYAMNANDHSYKAPSLSISYQEVLEYIDELPSYDDPIIFGMNIYAANMLNSQRANHLIESIAAMEPREASSTSGLINNDNMIVLKVCEEISSLLPESVVPDFEKGKHLQFNEALQKIQEKLGGKYYENAALITILRQEVDRYNRLLNVIHKALNDLMRAIKGEIMISKSLEKTFEAILIQKVPNDWEHAAYPSVKSLASWVRNLHKRTKFFSAWIRTVISYAEGTLNSINPFSFWISGFFFPQGLLTAISQNYARKLSVSIDSLQFQFTIQDHLIEDFEFEVTKLFDNEERYKIQDEGVLICGLFMDGVTWNFQKRLIVDSEKRFNVAPYFLCRLVHKSESLEESINSTNSQTILNKYKCPVYRNSIRAGSPNDQAKNFVVSIDLDCAESAEFWTLRGACMILQTDN